MKKLIPAAALLGLLQSTALSALEITNVSAEPRVVMATDQRLVTVRFQLSEPASVRLQIFDGRDLLVQSIDSGQLLHAGDNRLAWDLRDQEGRPVPPEAYRFTLLGETQTGTQVEHDLTDVTAGGEVKTTQVAWDAQAKVIRYRLPTPARVNIRLGLQNNGPLLRTLIDWVVRDAGEHQEPWDGFDASRVLDLSKHPKLQIAVDAFGLSDNAIIVGPPAARVHLIQDLPWGEVRRKIKRQDKKRMHFHRQQPLEARGDYRISLELPADLPQSEDGLPIVTGIVPVRLDIAEEDRERALARRFEPVFFVDGLFAFENEVGFLPMTWRWSTEGVNEGPHFLTANLRGYEGNFGMATVPVLVRHARERATEEQ